MIQIRRNNLDEGKLQLCDLLMKTKSFCEKPMDLTFVPNIHHETVV
jgi:hypothetical protein